MNALKLTTIFLWMTSLAMTTTAIQCEAFFELFNVFPCPKIPEVSYNAEALSALSSGFVYVCDRGRVYKDAGLGECGAGLQLVYTAPGEADLQDVEHAFVDLTPDRINIAVGDNGTIIRTTTSGWTTGNSPTTDNLRSICYTSDSGVGHFYAVGDYGTILHSTDKGANWYHLPSPTTANLDEVSCRYPYLYVFGYELAGYRSTDGGSTWTPANFPQSDFIEQAITGGPPDLLTSFFLNDSQGYVFGEFGIFFGTTDAGSQWFGGFAPGFNRINTAYFVSFDSGMVAGNNGRIRFTTDGGSTWFSDSIASSITTHNINHIGVIDSTFAVIVGDSGTVVFVARDSATLGVNRRSGALPSEFQLLQNYPNPFNPSTTISFEIPYASDVRLQVFDMAGREVATLVNERLNQGSYGFRFDGGGLASGVYLYRLEADPVDGKQSYSKVWKMILLR